MAVSLQPLYASEWSEELVQLFVQRGVPESVVRSGKGFTVTSMSSDAVTATLKAPFILTKDSKTDTLSDRSSLQVPQKPEMIFTQNEIAQRYKSGIKYEVVKSSGAILENVEFGEEGIILYGKIISGYVEQQGRTYAAETIFSAGLPDRSGLPF